MKQLIYCMIIAMSISLVFSGGKPCCNKKAGKNTVSCKFNQAAVDVYKDGVGELTRETIDRDQKFHKCNIADGSKCAKITKKHWWKFWKKESPNNCPCKQAIATKPTTSVIR